MATPKVEADTEPTDPEKIRSDMRKCPRWILQKLYNQRQSNSELTATIATQQKQIEEKDTEIEKLVKQLEEKATQLKDLEARIKEKEEQLSEKDKKVDQLRGLQDKLQEAQPLQLGSRNVERYDSLTKYCTVALVTINDNHFCRWRCVV